MKNLSLKMLILSTIIGATQTMHCTPSFFVRMKKVLNDKTVQLVDFVADIHMEVKASAAIEYDLFTHLDKLDDQAISNKISLYWEFPLGHIKRPLYSFKEYLKNPRGQFKEIVNSLEHGTLLNNDLLKRIQVKNIDLRTKDMSSIRRWACKEEIDQALLKDLTFLDVIEELSKHLKRFDAMQLDTIAQSELDWLRALKSKCDLVYANTKDKSLEVCTAAFATYDKPLADTLYNKDAARCMRIKNFPVAFFESYFLPVVDIDLYNAIKNDSNYHVIAFAGRIHTDRVMQMLLQSGYELVTAYKVSSELSDIKVKINDEWYGALPPLESFDILLKEA